MAGPSSGEFVCGLCLGRFTVPKALPCLHSFCQRCLDNYVNRDKEAELRGGILCPLCRKMAPATDPGQPKAQWASNWPTNFFLLQEESQLEVPVEPGETEQVEDCYSCGLEGRRRQAVSWCRDCAEAFCEACEWFHSRMPSLLSHALVELAATTAQQRQQDRRRVKPSQTASTRESGQRESLIAVINLPEPPPSLPPPPSTPPRNACSSRDSRRTAHSRDPKVHSVRCSYQELSTQRGGATPSARRGAAHAADMASSRRRPRRVHVVHCEPLALSERNGGRAPGAVLASRQEQQSPDVSTAGSARQVDAVRDEVNGQGGRGRRHAAAAPVTLPVETVPPSWLGVNPRREQTTPTEQAPHDARTVSPRRSERNERLLSPTIATDAWKRDRVSPSSSRSSQRSKSLSPSPRCRPQSPAALPPGRPGEQGSRPTTTARTSQPAAYGQAVRLRQRSPPPLRVQARERASASLSGRKNHPAPAPPRPAAVQRASLPAPDAETARPPATSLSAGSLQGGPTPEVPHGTRGPEGSQSPRALRHSPTAPSPLPTTQHAQTQAGTGPLRRPMVPRVARPPRRTATSPSPGTERPRVTTQNAAPSRPTQQRLSASPNAGSERRATVSANSANAGSVQREAASPPQAATGPRLTTTQGARDVRSTDAAQAASAPQRERVQARTGNVQREGNTQETQPLQPSPTSADSGTEQGEGADSPERFFHHDGSFGCDLTVGSASSACWITGSPSSSSSLHAGPHLRRPHPPKLVAKVSTRLKGNLEAPWVRDVAVLASGVLLATDFNDHSLKAWEWGIIKPKISILKLDSAPFGLTALDDTTVAVALPHAWQVVVVETRPPVTLTRCATFTSERAYFSLAALGPDRLAALCPDARLVDIVDLRGQVISTIQTDRLGRFLLASPYYMCVAGQGDLVLTDFAAGCVQRLSSQGETKWTWGRGRLQEPHGVCTDDEGFLYVADCSGGKARGNVWRVCPEGGGSVRVLTYDDDGLEEPWAVAWFKGHLVVADCGVIRVYRMDRPY